MNAVSHFMVEKQQLASHVINAKQIRLCRPYWCETARNGMKRSFDGFVTTTKLDDANFVM